MDSSYREHGCQRGGRYAAQPGEDRSPSPDEDREAVILCFPYTRG